MSVLPAARKPATTDYLVSLILATIFTFGSYKLGLHEHWINSIDWVEVTAVFFAYMAPRAGSSVCVRPLKAT